MARWDPDAEQRLHRAALDLYGERGFEHVSAAEIAERAGLARRTFFRYYADKREVLFAGADRLPGAVADAVRAAPAGLPPLEVALRALRQVGDVVVGLVEPGVSRERRAIIAASPELQERERTKTAAATAALADALHGRGVAVDTAHLVARIGVAVLETAFARWAVDGEFGLAFDRAVEEVAAQFAVRGS